MISITSLLLMASLFTTNQGQAVHLIFPHEPGIRSVEAAWQGNRIPFVQRQDQWVTVLGVDLEIKPGDHTVDVLVMRQDGSADKRIATIRVQDTRFPTTQLRVAEQFVQLSPENQRRAERESQEISRIFDTVSGEILWETPFSVPIPGGVGTNFGHRRVFNDEPRAPHNGADLRATTGTPIRSTNRGRAVLAKDLFFTGKTVIIDHGLGIYSLYAHLSEINVADRAMVENGQVVGLAGATGRVTGPHLHWGVRVQGARVDPFSLVNLASTTVGP